MSVRPVPTPVATLPLVRDDQRRTERGVGYEERLSFSLMKESIKVMKGVRRHNGVDCRPDRGSQGVNLHWS